MRESSVASDTAVVVAAYNAERTIQQAVKSVLTGTLPCDVFVVDDCSNIAAAEALGSYAHQVHLIRLEQNVGPGAARNVALSRILNQGYKYVAILDADDISDPTRLESQRSFLETHSRVGAVGTWVRLFDDRTGEVLYSINRSTEPDAIRKLMYFNIGVAHDTVMMRVEALQQVGLYSQDYPAAEDYELLRRISTHYDLANIPKCLHSYRISIGGQSRHRRRRQLFDRLRIQLRYFEVLEWRAWAGVIKTLVLLFLPLGIVDALKLKLRHV